MIDDPSQQSDDPPPAASSDVKPMSIAAATGWASGIVLVFWMLMVLVALHPSDEWTNFTSNAICQAIAYSLGLFLILRAHAPESSIRDFLAVRRTHFAFYPLALLIGLALQWPVQGLYAIISRRWPAPASEDRLIRLFAESGTGKRIVIGVMLVLAGPLVEEVFFRGALFKPLSRRYPPLIVITMTSIFFSISHGMAQMFIPIAIVGVALGIIRSESGSLIPGLILHATFNAVPFYALMTTPPDQLAAEDASLPPMWILGAGSAAALVLTGLVYVVGRRAGPARDAALAERGDLT